MNFFVNYSKSALMIVKKIYFTFILRILENDFRKFFKTIV